MASVGDAGKDGLALNIMPMLDIFSILILFLLMNFSTDPISHDLNKAVELPESGTIESLDEQPSIVVARDQILVNDKRVVDLTADNLSVAKDQGGIYPLFEELKRLADGNKRFTKDGKSADVLTLEMDKDHKFALLKKVMLTAQQADFIKFKLMVAKRTQ